MPQVASGVTPSNSPPQQVATSLPLAPLPTFPSLARALGADAVFDYIDTSVVQQVVAELESAGLGTDEGKGGFAGCLDAIHRHGAFEKGVEVVSALSRSGNGEEAGEKGRERGRSCRGGGS